MSISDILSISGQLILSLSILVVLHECGHFFPAKWFKTKVEKFYLFFDAGFSLFKKKIGDTEYGIGWIPFGGYVKIAGMVDESMDMEQLKKEPQPWEFRSKPAWQRLIIMIGGVVVNFILGILLFAMILNIWGRSFIKNDDLKYGIAVDSLGQKMGLRDGDKIISVGTFQLSKFSKGEIIKEIILNDAKTMNVLRDGQQIAVQIPGDVIESLTKRKNKDMSIIGPRFPHQIDSVVSGGIGNKIGLKKNDKVIYVNDLKVNYAHEFLHGLDVYRGKDMQLTVLRNNDTLVLKGKLQEEEKLQVYQSAADKYLTISKEKFSVGQAIPAGYHESVDFLANQIKSFGQMFKGKLSAKDNLGSIISMATLFSPDWNWEGFWRITAILSIMLAFFNILPIPALDGGYVLFLIIEAITGKKFSDSFMEKVTTAGFLLLITLMIFALGLDVTRIFK